jgi:hypothetical protein
MMNTQFYKLRDELEGQVTQLPVSKRALFLLAYAQRLAPVFDLFEKRAGTRKTSFQQVLDQLWAGAGGSGFDPNVGQELNELIPGEDWVVDGFHDAMAQYVGGLADGALHGLQGDKSIDAYPECAIFDVHRVLLNEMRLGCLEPADDEEGHRFESEIHNEQLVVDEASFWQQLLGKLDRNVSVEDLRKFIRANLFDTSKLEPDLTQGLERDRRGAMEWLRGGKQ